ncbi:uncharacterized protein PGTG_18047 [Puccinia graminis f. sp. tritici CRL 75-36-700-3]|uniref:Uncharacterized protein n=2 Tax=Puccinia graminis f. sp. tritici TaxID=56615 RepID=E3L5M8_PUCGT|nr:uncharacterized protein PGTG_18047 [Puccinia graminis f. sp. tritici CRL 75-36-700-3]EFP91853.2 hypothetical protein PGTG_18047 [Puccinia graminis f. sp. tritici CRL 75-36-700-3]
MSLPGAGPSTVKGKKTPSQETSNRSITHMLKMARRVRKETARPGTQRIPGSYIPSISLPNLTPSVPSGGILAHQETFRPLLPSLRSHRNQDAQEARPWSHPPNGEPLPAGQPQADLKAGSHDLQQAQPHVTTIAITAIKSTRIGILHLCYPPLFLNTCCKAYLCRTECGLR